VFDCSDVRGGFGESVLQLRLTMLATTRRSTLVPFLGVITAVLLAVRLTGLSPFGFFVSFGGYLWFALLAWIAAALVRAIRGLAS